MNEWITELAVVGGRAVVTAAVKDTIELAAAQVAAGRPTLLQQTWAGKGAALLSSVGVRCIRQLQLILGLRNAAEKQAFCVAFFFYKS